MNILILGGTSFVGPHIATQLSADGHTVTVFHRHPTFSRRPEGGAPAPTFFEGSPHNPTLPPTIHHLHGNRHDLPSHADALRSTRPDVVIDMLCFSRNDARQLLAVFPDTRLVVASSQDVYRAFGFVNRQEPAHTIVYKPLAEDAPLRASRFPHGRPDNTSEDDAYEKIFVEETLAPAGATILRMPATFGPNDPIQRVWQFLHQFDAKRPFVLLPPDYANWKWTHDYSENVAHAFALAATNPAAIGQTYNLGEPRTPTTAERAHHIARLASFRGKILALPRDRVPPHLALANFDLRQDLVFSSDKIRADLSYAEPIDPDTALRTTITWDRAHPTPFRGHPQPDFAAEDELLRTLGLVK